MNFSIFLFLIGILGFISMLTLVLTKNNKWSELLLKLLKLKNNFFLSILKDRYYMGSFFSILFICYISYNYNYLESLIIYVKMFFFTIGYFLVSYIQIFVIPLYIICFFKFFNVEINNHTIKFIIIKLVTILLIRWYLFIFLGLPYITNILFLDIDLLSLFDFSRFISKGMKGLDFFIKPWLPNISTNGLESTRFNTIQSPLDEYESFIPNRNSNSPRASSVNRSVYFNSPSPSSHLSPVDVERLDSNRSLSPPVSPTMSPLFGSGSLNGSFVSSPAPLVNESPLPLALPSSPLFLDASPIPYIGSPIRSISPWFSEEYITSEWVSKGKYNPEHNTINSSVTEPKKSIICSVLPNFKPVSLYYIDPNSQQSFTIFHTTFINHYDVKSIYISEVNKYYDPVSSIWWDTVNKRWVDSRLMYSDNQDIVDYSGGKFFLRGSYSSYHLNQKLKLLEYGSSVEEKIKNLNAKNMLLLNTYEYISCNKFNATKQELDNHFLSLNEQRLKTFFLRIFKLDNVDDAHDVVIILQNRFMNDSNVREDIKYQTNSLILQILAQRTQIRVLENNIGIRYLNYSDKYHWIKPSESIIKNKISNTVYSLPSE
jgi:hypothetical protein